MLIGIIIHLPTEEMFHFQDLIWMINIMSPYRFSKDKVTIKTVELLVSRPISAESSYKLNYHLVIL